MSAPLGDPRYRSRHPASVPDHVDVVADAIVDRLYELRPNEDRGNPWDLRQAVGQILRDHGLLSPYRVYPFLVAAVLAAATLGYYFGGL